MLSVLAESPHGRTYRAQGPAGVVALKELVFALVPALRASRVDLASSLKDGGRGTSGLPATRLRMALVVAQVAVCLFLLAGAGLMLRSFSRLLDVSPGFEPEGAISAELNPAGPAYNDDAARMRYFDEALRAAASVPGVQQAGGIDVLPTRGNYGLTYFVEGYQPRAGEPQPSDQIRRAMPGYFAAMSWSLSVYASKSVWLSSCCFGASNSSQPGWLPPRANDTSRSAA